MNKRKVYPKWFLITPVFLYIVFSLLPGLLGAGYSFTDWNSRSAVEGIHFVGVQNYKEIFESNTDYLAGIFNTLKFTVISNIVKLIPALLLAILLKEGMRGKGIYRTVLCIPYILPFVITGILFKSIFNYNTGLLNSLLDFLNLDFLKQKWLSDLNIVWGSIIGVDAWRGIGYCMTIFLAGLQAIPQSLYEAAKMDGANFWQRLTKITLPMLSGAITINMVFGITYGLKVFDIIYVLTNGGPGHATEVMTTYAFQLYSNGRYGMSTAMNTILLFIAAVIGIFVVRQMSKREVQQ